MKEARKRTPVIKLSESLPKTIIITADVENVSLLAECTQKKCGSRCLLSAVLARKSPSRVR
jgi:hypothetical protein